MAEVGDPRTVVNTARKRLNNAVNHVLNKLDIDTILIRDRSIFLYISGKVFGVLMVSVKAVHGT